MSDLTYIGDLTDDLLYGALSPDGSTLYAFELNRSFTIRSYAFPALTGETVVLTNVTGPMACDDGGTLYWVDDALNEAMTLAATQIWKNPASPTLVWSSAFSSLNPTVSLCWSPFDGLLYALVDGALTSIDPTSGTAVTLYAPSTGTPRIENGPTPTLDGGIWWSYSASSSSHRAAHYDITTGVGIEVGVPSSSYQDLLIPRPGGTTWGFRSLGSTGWIIDSTLTPTSFPDIAGIVLGARGVAYTPDLSLVVFGNRGTNGVWQVGGAAPPARWHFGHIGWRG